jgi:hypothetical protein
MSLTDPTGLDFSLSCSKDNGTTCQNGTVYYKDKNGDYNQTLVKSDDKGNLTDQSGNKYTASVTGAGVTFTGNGGTNVAGTFVNGTNPTTINGTGALAGFQFNFTYSNMKSAVSAGGTFSFNGNAEQATSALQAAGFNHYGWDMFDPFHPSTANYDAIDFRSPGGAGGAGSGHFSVHQPVLRFEQWKIPEVGVPTYGDVHLGEHNAYTGGFWEHAGETWRWFTGN